VTGPRALAALVLSTALLAGGPAPAHGAAARAADVAAGRAGTARDVVVNGSAERATGGDASPEGWVRSGPTAALPWGTEQVHGGRRSLEVVSDGTTPAAWTQQVEVTPGRLYVLSAWVRTEGVTDDRSDPNAGAQLAAVGTGARTTPLVGDHDWSYRSVVVRAPATGTLTIAARVGSHDTLQAGRATFDDVQLSPVLPATRTTQGWRVLAVVYGRTEVTVPGPDGSARRVAGSLDADAVEAGVRRFALTQVPALTSGGMTPTVTVAHRPLAPITFEAPDGWWLDPRDVAADVDAAGRFDAVMAFWQDETRDVETGEFVPLTDYAGLAPNTGAGPPYASIIANAANGAYRDLNVLKHEFGHQLITYHRGTAAMPLPEVDIHRAQDYVSCGSGAEYDLRDEKDDEPLPGSTYHDTSGFTHDYYSGTTALRDDPRRCLGIPASSWALGGPTTMTPRTLVPRAAGLTRTVEDLVAVGALTPARGRVLQQAATRTAAALDHQRVDGARRALGVFVTGVDRLERTGRLAPRDARVLRDDAAVVADQLPPDPEAR